MLWRAIVRYASLRRWIPFIAGSCLCCAAALVATILFAESSAKPYLPLLFLIIIACIAVWFGNGAGIVGTIAAGGIFATFLYQPKLSPLIADAAARNHVIWMVLVGIVISDLLGAYSTTGPSRFRF